MDQTDERFAEMIGYFPARSEYPFEPHEYAEHLYRATQAVKIPVIGSINGHTRQSCLTFAPLVEQTGAAALEVNWYEVNTAARASGAAIEDELVEMVRDVKRIIKIPLAIKLSPFFAAFANVAHQLDAILSGRVRASLAITGGVAAPQDGIKAVLAVPMRCRWSTRCCNTARRTSR
jgi:hypothetical protein